MKEKRSRAAGKNIFDKYGIPQSRVETSTRPLPKASQVAAPPQRTPLGELNPHIHMRLSKQKSELMTFERPVRAVVENTGSRLVGTTAILGSHLKAEQARNDARVNRPQFGSLTRKSEDIHILRSGDLAQWVMPIKSVTGVQADGGKTLGCIREKGSKEILMTSQSGWLPSSTSNGNLLDSSSWTEAVLEFCKLLKHKLPVSKAYDYGTPGKFFACHVEKKLILYFVCQFLTNGTDGHLDAKKLRELRQRSTPLEAVLTIDVPPCDCCIKFRDEMEKLTGIVFTIERCKVTGQTELYTHGTSRKRRPIRDQNQPLKLFRNKGQSKIRGTTPKGI